MSEPTRLLLTAWCSGMAGIFLCTLLASVELQVARRRYTVAHGELPVDIQRIAWRKTTRWIGIIGIAGMLVVTHRLGISWQAVTFIVSYLAGAYLRFRQAGADLANR